MLSTNEKHCWINRVPVLLVSGSEPATAGRQGTILVSHGLFASKETQRKELYSLAEHGFLAVGMDNAGHGERRYPDLESRFNIHNPETEQNLIKAVLETVDDIPLLIDGLLEIGFCACDRLGICGISMGGMIAYAAVLKEPRLKVATPILGSPQFMVDHPRSPHLLPERFYPVALLAQNAGADRNVPPHFARSFHQELGPYYTEKPERLNYIEYPGVGHFMPEKEWNSLWGNVLDWFSRFLSPFGYT